MNYEGLRLTSAAQAALDEYLEDYVSELVEQAYVLVPQGEVKTSDLMTAIRRQAIPEAAASEQRQIRMARFYALLGTAYAAAGSLLSLFLLVYAVTTEARGGNAFLEQPLLLAITGGMAASLLGSFLGFVGLRRAQRLLERTNRPPAPSVSEWVREEKRETALGQFLSRWQHLEDTLRQIFLTLPKEQRGHSERRLPVGDVVRILNRAGKLPLSQVREIDELRVVRNRLMHGELESFPPAELFERNEQLAKLVLAIDSASGS